MRLTKLMKYATKRKKSKEWEPNRIFWWAFRVMSWSTFFLLAILMAGLGGLLYEIFHSSEIAIFVPLGTWIISGYAWVMIWNGNRCRVLEKVYIKVIPASTIMCYENGDLIAIDKNTQMWIWDERLVNKHELVARRHLVVSCNGKLSPVTTNPKVRFLHYTISFGTDGEISSCLQLGKLLGNTTGWHIVLEQRLAHWLKYQLFELNESLSKDMAVFYNPLEPKQQNQFRELMSEFLTPRLPEELNGLVRIEGAIFNLA